MSEEDFIKQKSKWLPKIKAWVESRAKDPIIPISVALEQKLAAMTPDEAEAYCKSKNTRSMVCILLEDPTIPELLTINIYRLPRSLRLASQHFI